MRDKGPGAVVSQLLAENRLRQRGSTCGCEARVGKCHRLMARELEAEGGRGAWHRSELTAGTNVLSVVEYCAHRGGTDVDALYLRLVVREGVPVEGSPLQVVAVVSNILRRRIHWDFRCPGWTRNMHCDRYVRTLHLPRGATRWACRHCAHEDPASLRDQQRIVGMDRDPIGPSAKIDPGRR